jgi:hypothetical protein
MPEAIGNHLCVFSFSQKQRGAAMPLAKTGNPRFYRRAAI